jgi:alkanesulfonate monooxygenase SsuD/methylene tetrahydromethanopterin reductase-like flavin-dependent oxidoreductase (luciferase family)
VGLAPGLSTLDARNSLDAEIERIVALTHAARDAGCEMLRAGHHLLEPWRMLHPLLLFSRLAAESGDMDLVTGVYLLPLVNPFELAEQAAALDAITRGRFKLGVGLGYRPEEFEVMGVSLRHRPSRFTDAVHILRKLWAGETVTSDGPHFRASGVRIGLKPDRQIPIWIAAAAEAPARRAGRIGDGILPVGFDEESRLLDIIRWYREGRAEAGKKGSGEVVMSRYVHIGATRSAAMEEARTYLAAFWDNERYHTTGMEANMGGLKLHRSWEDVVRERAVVGTVDDVIEGLTAFCQRLGITRLFVHFRDPKWSVAQHVEAIRLLGREVIPELKKVAAQST